MVSSASTCPIIVDRSITGQRRLSVRSRSLGRNGEVEALLWSGLVPNLLTSRPCESLTNSGCLSLGTYASYSPIDDIAIFIVSYKFSNWIAPAFTPSADNITARRAMFRSLGPRNPTFADLHSPQYPTSGTVYRRSNEGHSC